MRSVGSDENSCAGGNRAKDKLLREVQLTGDEYGAHSTAVHARGDAVAGRVRAQQLPTSARGWAQFGSSGACDAPPGLGVAGSRDGNGQSQQKGQAVSTVHRRQPGCIQCWCARTRDEIAEAAHVHLLVGGTRRQPKGYRRRQRRRRPHIRQEFLVDCPTVDFVTGGSRAG